MCLTGCENDREELFYGNHTRIDEECFRKGMKAIEQGSAWPAGNNRVRSYP